MRKYFRLTRMNAIYDYMLTNRSTALTKLSFEFDFIDQSHFIREHKRFTGIAPGKFIKTKNDLIFNPAINPKP